jgi:predicted RNA-binding Zn-ribbon protein involved in translation (DUF1610 family)
MTQAQPVPSETGLQKALDQGMASGRLIAVCSTCHKLISPENHLFRLCPNCGPFGRDTCEPRYRIKGDPFDYERPLPPVSV